MQVIMREYKPGDEKVDIPEDELKSRVMKRLETSANADSQKTEMSNSETSAKHDESEHEDRPNTPDYEELNARFQSLLTVLGSRNNSEVTEDDNVFEEPLPPGSVPLSCSKPPDILDFTRRSLSDLELELEDVNITLDGIEVVNDNKEEDLPDHIQEMVNKAMREID